MMCWPLKALHVNLSDSCMPIQVDSPFFVRQVSVRDDDRDEGTTKTTGRKHKTGNGDE